MELQTLRTRLRPIAKNDVDVLHSILLEPSVRMHWTDFSREDVVNELLEHDDTLSVWSIEDLQQRIIGCVQASEESDPQYRHAGIDLFLSTAVQGQGIGQEVLHAVVQYLFNEKKHHRITIDPAERNTRAIHAYERVGFRPVGLLRRYEQAEDGTWHDGLLMELLQEDYVAPASKTHALSLEQGRARRANEHDVPWLLSAMVDFNRGENIVWNPSVGEALLRRLLSDSSLGWVFLYEFETQRRGYAVVSLGFDLEFGGNDSFLTEFYLQPELRGKKQGEVFLQQILDTVTKHRVHAMHLQVRPDNPQARRLYRRLGFEHTTRMFLSRRL